jgi:glycosyltransferase involved in cell wall biosynthesis
MGVAEGPNTAAVRSDTRDVKTQGVFIIAPAIRPNSDETSSIVADQVTSLRRLGWKVVVGVVDDRTSIPGILRNVRRLATQVAHVKPSVVHAQYGTVTAAIAHCVRGERPLIVSFTGEDLLGSTEPGVVWWLRSRMGRRISLFAARRADAITVKSQNLKTALPADLRRKATVLPDGVDMEFFAPLDRAEARQKLGWGNDRVVLFASSRGKRAVKNLPLAQASMNELRRQGTKARLAIISSATRQEVLWMLNAADCLLVTSHHEGSPNIVKEAMACKLPVVSVPCGDVVQRLVGLSPGRIVDYNAGELAAAMAEVLVAGSRSNGRQRLESQGLAISAISERLAAIYLGLTAIRQDTHTRDAS